MPLASCALVVAFACVGSFVRPAVADESSAAVELARASTIVISAHLGERHDAIGAGVVIATTAFGIRVLTALHVVRGGPVTVWIDGHPYPAEIARTFAHRDLALVDALVARDDLGRLRAAPFGGASDVGASLVISGENQAGFKIVHATLVSSAYASLTDPEAPPLVAIACDACDRGDSGGGIFSADGKLLGILTARYVAHDRRILAIVGERVEASLIAGERDIAQTR